MKLFRVLVLTLALSGSVYAGNIQNGITQSEPATTTQTSTEQTPTVAEILLAVVRVLGLI